MIRLFVILALMKSIMKKMKICFYVIVVFLLIPNVIQKRERHFSTLTHRKYDEKLMNKIDFSKFNLKELTLIIKAYKLDITNLKKIKKEDIVASVKKYYDEGSLTDFKELYKSSKWKETLEKMIN